MNRPIVFTIPNRHFHTKMLPSYFCVLKYKEPGICAIPSDCSGGKTKGEKLRFYLRTAICTLTVAVGHNCNGLGPDI